MSAEPPYSEIDTLFLDVGNTLMSIDFDWIARELAERGVRCSAHHLRLAEAAARPVVSRRLSGTEGEGRVDFSFADYLAEVLEQLGEDVLAGGEARAEMAGSLVPVLHAPGKSSRLWCWVLPGVPEALARFRARGLRLVVVSNSDGTVARGLREQGLHHHFDAIVDSHLVGYAKPDPRIFHHALEAVGAVAERTLHVGDLYAADVVGARQAGVHPLLLDPFGDWGAVDCATLPDLSALAERMSGPGR
jgi:putative hydrolase of the HAD superfamily